MNRDESITSVYNAVENYLLQGLMPDAELLHFLNSAYGLTGHDEVIEFISNGNDSDAVMDLLSYPSDTLRISVERFIPDEGISAEELKDPVCARIFSGRYFILLDEKKISLTENDSFYCCRKLIQRLNMHLDFSYLSVLKDTLTGIDFYEIRALLRKKKFSSGFACCEFIRDLIAGCNSYDEKSMDEFLNLISTACDMLNNSQENPHDIFSVKREYYKNAYIEALEFAKLLKSYSMEFIMMNRIQPPLITAEGALSMLEIISRISCIGNGIFPVRL